MISALKEACSKGERDTCTQVTAGRKQGRTLLTHLEDSNQNVVLKA